MGLPSTSLGLRTRWSRLRARPSFDIVLLVVVGLGVGLAVFGDYGLSWDEYRHEIYARQTLQTYFGERPPENTLSGLKRYGPVFNVFWLLSRNALVRLGHGLAPADAGHLVYYLTFLLGVVSLFGLARRIAGRPAGYAAVLLFVAQPAVFGHAFVNPKDIPFMGLFAASVWAGLSAADRLLREAAPLLPAELAGSGRRRGQDLMERWKGTSSRGKILLTMVWAAVLLLAVDLFLWGGSLHSLESAIHLAHAGNAGEPLQSLFDWIAEDAARTPVEVYLQKAKVFGLWARYLLVGGAGLLALWVSRRILRADSTSETGQGGRAWTALAAAGLLLALCSATRVLGLYAGGLITFLLIARLGRRAWVPVAVYWLVGLGVLYLVWPYLWNDPIRHLLDSVVVMVRFPFTGRVLYQGQVYGVTEIPWHYLFASLLYQLTLPALVLGFAGTVLAVVARRRVETAVHLLWLLLPLGTALLLGAQVYDAFRQMLFILPPFFVLGALTWERVFRKVGGAGWRALIVAVAILPGLVAIVRLHPYEAIYHNELVGGVRGAFRRFELDGWCLSYREAIETINAVAPQGARVGVPTEAFTVQPFAREDLRVQPLRTDADWPSGQAGYLLTCTRSNADLKRFPDAEILWVVERDGAWLTVVKRLP